MALLSLLLSIVGSAFKILFLYWWIWLPPMLIVGYLEAVERFARMKYISGLKWVTLELKVPRDSHRSPKAMEQTFAGLHVIGAVWAPKALWDRFKAWQGKVFGGKTADWLSLEIVSIGGQIHFYIRCLESHRAVIQAQIYAHYPEAEISEVDDYTSQLPALAPNDEYEVNGQELGLTKEDVYPIRTYQEFEEEHSGKDDAMRIDPLAPVAEAMGALNLGEYFGIQFLIRSADDSWTKKAKETFNKILEVPEKNKDDFLVKAISGIEGGVSSLFISGDAKKEEKKEEKKGKEFRQLSPGMQDVVKAIERSLAKFGFFTGIRMMYIARKDRFVKERVGSVAAAFKLFSSQALNGFKPTFSMEVFKGFKKAEKTLYNKQVLYQRYRARSFPDKPFILTTEEMATVFHFPDVHVRTPTLPRIDAKKGEPPAGLPIV